MPAFGTEPSLVAIDSKFPIEDYHRLLEATEKQDVEGMEAQTLSSQLKAEARKIRDKYINPPKTLPYGIMFLPIESGVYAK